MVILNAWQHAQGVIQHHLTLPNHTQKYQQHAPIGFKLNVVNSISETVDTIIYRGTDCMEVFCKKIREIERGIMKIIATHKPIVMTHQDKEDFANATQCYLCEYNIVELGGILISVHTSLRRVCHLICNIFSG